MTFTIGVLTPGVSTYRSRHDFFVRLLSGIRSAATQHGCNILVVLGSEHRLAANRVDGWVLIMDTWNIAESLSLSGKPIVSLHVSRPDLGIPSIGPDNKGGIRNIVSHLVEHGHKKIAFIGSHNQYDLKQRFDAYKETLAEHFLPIDTNLILEVGENTYEETYMACRNWLNGRECTAIVCPTDDLALGVLRAINESGYRVPADIALVGFDDMAYTEHIRPTLTTVRQDVEMLGFSAVENLMSLIAGNSVPAETTIPTSLVLRRSCGCRDMTIAPELGALQQSDWCNQLINEIAQNIPKKQDSGPQKGTGRESIAILVQGLDATLTGGTLPHLSQIESACDKLAKTTGNLKQLSAILDLIEQAGRQQLLTRYQDIGAPMRLKSFIWHIRMELMHAHHILEQSEFNWASTVLNLTYKFSTTFFGEEIHQAQKLDWLKSTPAIAGCLAIWNKNKKEDQLVIAGLFKRDNISLPSIGSQYDLSDFPAPGFGPPVNDGNISFSLLIPLVSGEQNWGVLQIWPEPGAPYYTYVLWAQILSIALERASLLKSLNLLVFSPENNQRVNVIVGKGSTSTPANKHNELQFMFIKQGSITYFIDGKQTTFAAGCTVLFWAAVPHHIVTIQPNTNYIWITVPLVWLLQRNLPDSLIEPLLKGRPIYDCLSPSAAGDEMLFHRWYEGTHGNENDEQEILLLEIEARLRRLARANNIPQSIIKLLDDKEILQNETETQKKAEQMAQHIARHYDEPLRVVDLARIVGLHPNYAITLFREATGISPIAYLTKYRIAHAQRLLATTNAKITEIALDSGFTSMSHFYAVFKRTCGLSPNEYRRSPYKFAS